MLNGTSRMGVVGEQDFANFFKHECGDKFSSSTEQIIQDVQNRSDAMARFNKSNKNRDKVFSFTFLDEKKWPFKLAQPEDYVVFPKQIRSVQEDFTQMYEKMKRVTQQQQSSKRKDGKPD